MFPDQNTNPAFPEGFVRSSSSTDGKESEKLADSTSTSFSGASMPSDSDHKLYAPRMFPTFYENEPW